MKDFYARLGDRASKNANLVRLLVIFILSFAAMSLIQPQIFLTKKYIVSMAFLFPEYGILALAMMLAMMSGGIDLSVVATANFSGIIAVQFLLRFCPMDASGLQAVFFLIAALVIAVAVGALCGLLIGAFVGKLGIPPMVATLGGADLIMGASLIITKGSSVNGLPNFLSAVGTKILFGFLPVTVLVFAACAAVISYLLQKTPYGLKLRMMGSNAVASRFSGIDNDRLLLKTYMIGGMLSAVAGLLLISRANSGRADYGASYVMQVIIICVLGGVNPNGGFGKVGGLTVAILILQVLSSGFNMFPSLSNFYRSIIWGLVLILVVIYNHISARRRMRKLERLAA